MFCLHFHLSQVIYFPLAFFFDWLLRSMLFHSHVGVFPSFLLVADFYFHTIMMGFKQDLNQLKFVKTFLWLNKWSWVLWSSHLLHWSATELLTAFFSSVIAFFSSMVSSWYFLIIFPCWNSYSAHALVFLPQWASLWPLIWTHTHSYLSDKSLISVSLQLLLGDLSVWNIQPCLFIFLDSLCWFLYIK